MNISLPDTVTVGPPSVPSVVMAPPMTTTVVVPVAGPKGDTGGTGEMGYVYTASNQTLAQIQHGLTFTPAGIVCLDTSAPPVSVEYASVSYPAPGITELTFGFPFSGTIYLS